MFPLSQTFLVRPFHVRPACVQCDLIRLLRIAMICHYAREDEAMTSEQEHRLAKPKARGSIKEFFGYEVIWLLPMTPKRRDKWAKVRAKGLSRYMLRHILVSTIGIAISYATFSVIFLGVEWHRVKTDLIVGAAIGAVSGLGAYLRWVHNEVEYTKRPAIQPSSERDY